MSTWRRETLSSQSARAAWLPWLLGGLVLLSRFPYLRPGYGSDPDAYRVIAVARVLRGGEYFASRLPGYPLHELATALLLPGGPRLVNGATALMSALSAVALFELARQLGLSLARSVLLGLAFAFTPVVYQNSSCALDYLWSSAFALWAALQVVRGRPVVAGLLLGAAIGARITAGALLVPLLVLQLGAESPRARARALALMLAAAGGAGLCYAPVLHRYGLSFFSYDGGPLPWSIVWSRATGEVWGSFGQYAWFGVAVLAACAIRPLRALFARQQPGAHARRPPPRSVLLACASALALFGVAFVLLPHDAAYLIPCVAFVLLLVAYALPTLAIAELACLLAVSCFVTLDQDGFALPGPIPAQKQVRSAQDAQAKRVIRQMSRIDGKALIVAGPRLPLIEAKLGSSQQGSHQYVYLLQSEQELTEYLRQGYQLYYVDPGVERPQRELFGIALRDYGARRLR